MSSEDATTTPPLFTQSELSGSTATASLDLTTILALFAFVGTVVRCTRRERFPPLSPPLTPLVASSQVFCAVQALANPRRTFCAELNGVSEPAAAAVPQPKPKRSRKVD